MNLFNLSVLPKVMNAMRTVACLSNAPLNIAELEKKREFIKIREK